MAAIELDANFARSQLQTLVSSWTWNFDALLILKGEQCDEAGDRRSAAMHAWFFNMEFPESAIIIRKTGQMVVLASPAKLKYLESLQGDSVILMPRTKGIKDLDPAQISSVEEAIREGKIGNITIGTLLRDQHKGVFAQSILNAVKNFSDVSVEECRDALSDLLSVKSPQEIEKMRKACNVSVHLMEKFVNLVEAVVDGDQQVSNKQVAKELDGVLESGSFVDTCKQLGGLDADGQIVLHADDVEIQCAALQSGTSFELKPLLESTEERVPMNGTYVMSLAVQYSLYCAFIARTIMVDPTSYQKVAYAIALEAQELVISSLKPGAVFQEVHEAAVGFVRKKQPALAACFVKLTGWSIGLELRDPQIMLNGNCTKVVKPGMVFCVSVGFNESNSSADVAAGVATKAAPYAIWICDTVLVEESDASTTTLTAGASKALSDIMYELGEPADDEPMPAAPAKVAPAKVAPAVASVPKTAAAPTAPAPSAPAKTPPQPKAAGKAKSQPKAKVAAPKQSPQKKVKPERAPQQAAPRQSARQSAGEPVRETRSSTRGKSELAKQNMQDLAQLEDQQVKLRQSNLEEKHKRFLGPNAENLPGQVSERKLHEYEAYKSPAGMPASLRPNQAQMDMDADALLVPIAGALVPFHVRAIKNITRSSMDTPRCECLRVNFFCPGQGKSLEDFPIVNGQRLYVRELTFRSLNPANFDKIVYQFKELGRKMKQQAIEGDVRSKGSVPDGMEFQTLRSNFPCVRDLNMRPTFGHAARRTIGTFEAHANGFRFNLKGSSDKLDIFYAQVAHAIFEPCEKQSLIVVLHLHLKEPMMVGKKKTQDIQFFTEVANQSEDLAQMKSGSAYDPDEVMAEEREREMKERLNKVFKDFCTKVDEVPVFKSCQLYWDIPFQDLSFSGVPYKQGVQLVPCSRALVGLQEWPPFCISIDDIDIVVFERAANVALREFDIAFVKKNYDEVPVRITMVPKLHLDMLKRWLGQLNVVWYSIGMNMQWPLVMKKITSNVKEFVECGGWDPWFMGNDDDDSEAKESGSDFEDGDDDGEDSDGSDADDNSEASAGDDEDDEDGESDDAEEDSGMDWDELEAHADRSDKKRDAAEREKARLEKQPEQPPPKRRKR